MEGVSRVSVGSEGVVEQVSSAFFHSNPFSFIYFIYLTFTKDFV